MPGPAPKPNALRSRSDFTWTDLPAEGRKGKPPALPKLRKWSPLTVAAWNDWWSTPQAAAWDQSGRSLVRWAVLFDMMLGDEASAAVHVQMTALEDRHGFTPQALMKMRWRVVRDEVAAKRPASEGKSSKARRLKAV